VHTNGNGIAKWMELCEQAAMEQDPKKLNVLIAAIMAALNAKEKRLKEFHNNGQSILNSTAQP
jgi:ABC-type transporter Mla subunit MlaD